MSTFKLKIGAIAVVCTVALTGLMLMLSVSPLGREAEQDVLGVVERSSKLVSRSQRLKAFELARQAKAIAIRREFAAAIQESEEKARRAAVYDSINQLDEQLAGKGRKPGFLGVVGKDGRIIARDLDPNADYGERLAHPAVKVALAGGPASAAYWLMNSKMMRAAVAPILGPAGPLGAVVIAYQMTATEARDEHSQFGGHIAYFMGDAIRASSLTVAGDPNTEDGAAVGALTKQLLAKAKDAASNPGNSQLTEISIRGERFEAIAGPLPVSVSIAGPGSSGDEAALLKAKPAGFVVLASVDAARALVRRTRWMVLLFGGLFLLGLVSIMWFVARHFVSAEDQLELGVNEIINGNLDYTFDALQEFEGLANALNVMLARLLGRPEPGDEEESEGTWRADVIVVDEVPPGGGDRSMAQQLSAEPHDQYLSRLYREYVEARRKAGLPTEGVTEQDLTQKLYANEAMLRAKHKCQAVRFVVRSGAGKVTFQPVLIS